jgi:hypothetical protein
MNAVMGKVSFVQGFAKGNASPEFRTILKISSTKHYIATRMAVYRLILS